MYPSLLSSVACVGADLAAIDVLVPAVRRIAPGLPIRSFDRWAEVPAAAAGGAIELLVLCDPDVATLADSQRARDAAALPRWPVLVLGRLPQPGEDETTVLPREEWTGPALERAIRHALVLHGWRRKHAQLCGDLATFGTRIAHDLRTPLGGVLTTTEMLREILAESDPPNAALTEPILESAESLVKLIERMSFFAKAVASGEPAERVNMGHPFWNAFQQLESRLLAAHATLTHPHDWPVVLGHPGWLQAVWRELLLNAVQHGAADGRVEAGWTATPEGNRFWVRDHGRLAAGRQAMLLMPFHRLNEPGAPRGLGLAIVRRLIELEGGTCGFAPTSDGESVFHFSLPAVTESETLRPPAPPAA